MYHRPVSPMTFYKGNDMARSRNYYEFHAFDQTHCIEPILNITDVWTPDQDKDSLILACLREGLNRQQPSPEDIVEDLRELQRTGGYAPLYDDLTRIFRVTDGENVYEVITHPSTYLNEFDDPYLSVEMLWGNLIEDALKKVRMFPVERVLNEHEYQEAKAYPFRLTMNDVIHSPMRRLSVTDNYEPFFIKEADSLKRIDIFTRTYLYGLLDHDYRTIAMVPVKVKAVRVDDDMDMDITVTHERENVTFEGGKPLAPSNVIANILNLRVDQELKGEAYYMIRAVDSAALEFTNNLPNRRSDTEKALVEYQQGLQTQTRPMALIEASQSWSDIRETLVTQVLVRLSETLPPEAFHDLMSILSDPRQGHPLQSWEGWNVAVTDGEEVYEAQVDLSKLTPDATYADLCRTVAEELVIRDSYPVAKVQRLEDVQNVSLDPKKFRLR